ncbi:MAG: PKD domain-containing protein [Thermoplasmata archaeon]|nr:PKD domain-containing protein [Thermoplasmata archaeon]
MKDVRIRGFRGVAVALVVVLSFLGTVPLVAATSSASPAHPNELTPTSGTPAAPTATPAPRGLPPPLACPNGYPVYLQLPGGVWPLDPNFNFQGPCHLIAVDEIHASFASGTAGSAARWSIPWTLPSQGAAGQQAVEQGLYVGMVVSGDPHSMWNQSYLEVLATPGLNSSGNLTWGVHLAVLSFENMTAFHPVGCPPSTMNLSWNGTYYCEVDDVANNQGISLFSNLTGGTPLVVTFDGTVQGTTGMRVWVNETSGTLNTSMVHLDANTTGNYTFEPTFGTSCASGCSLTWGETYGLGVGVDICPSGGAAFAACDAYNGSAYPTLPPVNWGIPEYYNATTYGGDYHYLLPESASGVCNLNPPNGVTVAACYEYTNSGGDGFYPYFSLTRSGLDFGTTYPATVTSWGGAYRQFLDTPGTQDLLPFVETGLADSSLAGFVSPNTAVNVSVNVTDLGTIGSTTLAWSANGSAWTTDTMTGVGGPSGATYTGTIPTGPNGVLLYQVNSTNAVGIVISSAVERVVRGPLPSFTVHLGIVPGTCGTITVAGTPRPNGSSFSIGPGPVPISASGCYPFNFTYWQTTGGLSVRAGGSQSATLLVAGPGNLTAVFTYVRPNERLDITVAPAACGNVVIDGTPYANATAALVSFGLSHALAQTVLCAGYAFGGWTPSANVSVAGDTLVAIGNGTLTATFVPTSTTAPVAFATNPAACGGVALGGAVYTTGESLYLYPGAYALTASPCRHYGLANFTTVGTGVSVSGTSLTVDASGAGGTVVENNFALTEVYVDTNPATCGGIVLDGTTYTNGVYVPVSNHSSYTVTGFSCSGHYLEGLTASGGLTLSGSLLTVNGSGALLVVSLLGTPTIYVGIVTEPGRCGAVELGGTDYINGAFVTLSPGTVESIQAIPCPAYGNVAWSVTGAINISGGQVTLNGSGAIIAIFGAIVPILIDTVPATCGSAVIDGVPYTNGGSASLINGRTYTITGAACPHYELAYFESSPYVQIANNTIDPNGPSTVTAVFVPVVYPVAVGIYGLGCGRVDLNGVPTQNGAVVGLAYGNYTLTETPCLTSEFVGFVTGGSVAVGGTHLFVNGSGNLSATFIPIPPVVTLGGTSGDFVGGAALFYAQVAVLVASSGYTYLWNFGDGVFNTSVDNTTTHVYVASGTYTVSVEVIDPFHRSANASLAVTVVAQAKVSYTGALETGALVLGVAALALAVIWLVGRRREPPPGSGAESEPVPAAEPAPLPSEYDLPAPETPDEG